MSLLPNSSLLSLFYTDLLSLSLCLSLSHSSSFSTLSSPIFVSLLLFTPHSSLTSTPILYLPSPCLCLFLSFLPLSVYSYLSSSPNHFLFSFLVFWIILSVFSSILFSNPLLSSLVFSFLFTASPLPHSLISKHQKLGYIKTKDFPRILHKSTTSEFKSLCYQIHQHEYKIDLIQMKHKQSKAHQNRFGFAFRDHLYGCL